MLVDDGEYLKRPVARNSVRLFLLAHIKKRINEFGEKISIAKKQQRRKKKRT
jgi:hypothetical protein